MKNSFSWKHKIWNLWGLVKNILKRSCRIFPQMSVKFKENAQWYKFFHVGTALATAVYYKNVTKNID